MGLFDWFKKKKQDDSIIRIRLSGDENLDIENSFMQMGIRSKEEQTEILKNYTWHYLDNLDENLECTMQLVQTDALEAAKPFLDSRDIFEEVTGTKYNRKTHDNSYEPADRPTIKKIDVTDVREASMNECRKAGFKPVNSLPTIKDIELRPDIEIARRLHAIKSLVLWLLVSEEDLPNNAILKFIERNDLSSAFTDTEYEIFNLSRDDEELRNAIGWKFENVWPLAWYFGYKKPDILGQMMTGEQIQEIFLNHSCKGEELIENWTSNQITRSEEDVIAKEDLFYCVHNAVRSAQLGRDTVPNDFDPQTNGGVIHERRHSLTWMLSKGIEWDDTDLST